MIEVTRSDGHIQVIGLEGENPQNEFLSVERDGDWALIRRCTNNTGAWKVVAIFYRPILIENKQG